MIFDLNRILVILSIGALSLTGCASQKLDHMTGRMDYAGRQMNDLIEKGEKRKAQKEDKVESIREQLERDAERTKRQQEEALKSIENLRSVMSSEPGEGIQETQRVLSEVPPAHEHQPAEADLSVSQAVNTVDNVMLADADPRFRSAYADYSRGRYDLAIQGFDNLRQVHEKGMARARVEYFLGECYYNKLEFAKALTHFAAVGKYAKEEGLLAPSLWKRAMSYEKLDLPSRRNESLQELVTRFPNSEEAGLANEWLTGNAP